MVNFAPVSSANPTHVGTRGSRQISKFLGGLSGSFPASDLFVDRFACLELSGVAGRHLEPFALQPIGHTNADRIDRIEAVQIGDRQFVDAIDHRGITRGNRHRTSRSGAGVRWSRRIPAPWRATCPQTPASSVGNASFTHARGVGFHHAETTSIRCGGTPVPVHAPPAVVFDEVT